MTAIDYEALAKALYEESQTQYGRSVNPAWGEWKPDIQRNLVETHSRMARAVVAALKDQGLVVVPDRTVKRMAVTIAAYREEVQKYVTDYELAEVIGETEQHLSPEESDMVSEVPHGYLSVRAWLDDAVAESVTRERDLMRPVAEALDAWVENPYHDRAESFTRLVQALKEWRQARSGADATLRAIEQPQER